MAELGDTLYAWQEQVHDSAGESSWATITAGTLADVRVIRALVTRKLEIAHTMRYLAVERQCVTGNPIRLAEFQLAKVHEDHVQ